MYGTPFYVTHRKSYSPSKTVRFFWPTLYVFIVIIVIVISQHSEPVYWSCAEDIVRHWLSYCNSCEVAGVPSIEWLMNW